jgi:hypothetical protein
MNSAAANQCEYDPDHLYHDHHEAERIASTRDHALAEVGRLGRERDALRVEVEEEHELNRKVSVTKTYSRGASSGLIEDLSTEIVREVSDLAPWAYSYKERPDDLLEVRASELESIIREQLAALEPTDRTTPVDPLAELLRLGAVNRELRAEVARLKADVAWRDFQLVNAEAEAERLKRYERDFPKTVQHCGPKCACVSEQREALADSEAENERLKNDNETLKMLQRNQAERIDFEVARVERLRAALQRTNDQCGHVCNTFESCAHVACKSSYEAWSIANAALQGETPESANEKALRAFHEQTS